MSNTRRCNIVSGDEDPENEDPEDEDTKPLPENSSAWGEFKKFDTVAGSWTQFNIEIEVRDIFYFCTDLLPNAAKDCSLIGCVMPEKLHIYEALVFFSRKLRVFSGNQPASASEATGGNTVVRKLNGALNFISDERKILKTVASYDIRNGREKALEIFESVIHITRVVNMGTMGGGGVTQTNQTEKDHIPEYYYQAIMRKIVNIFFSYSLEGSLHEAVLHPLNKEYRKTDVRCEADLELRSTVKHLSSEEHQYTLFVGEVKKNIRPPPDPCNIGVLKNCRYTIHEHFAQLLVCIQSSLFAQDWHEASTNARKKHRLPLADKNYMFGFMQHGTKFQLTCLRLSKTHLSKIVKRLRNVHIRDDSPSSTEGDKEQASMKENVDTMQGEKGQLIISPTFDLADLFKDARYFSDMIGFLMMLAQYEFVFEDKSAFKPKNKFAEDTALIPES